MPLYEFYCENCHGIFEEIRQMREASLPAPCPECVREGARSQRPVGEQDPRGAKSHDQPTVAAASLRRRWVFLAAPARGGWSPNHADGGTAPATTPDRSRPY